LARASRVTSGRGDSSLSNERGSPFFSRDGHGHELRVEGAGGEGCAGLLLRRDGEGVLLVAGDLPLLGHVLGRLTHDWSGKRAAIRGFSKRQPRVLSKTCGGVREKASSALRMAKGARVMLSTPPRWPRRSLPSTRAWPRRTPPPCPSRRGDSRSPRDLVGQPREEQPPCARRCGCPPRLVGGAEDDVLERFLRRGCAREERPRARAPRDRPGARLEPSLVLAMGVRTASTSRRVRMAGQPSPRRKVGVPSPDS